MLHPTTPTKNAKLASYAGASTPINNPKEISDESATMEDASDDEEADALSKKKKKNLDAKARSFLGGQIFANHLPTAISYLAQADSY